MSEKAICAICDHHFAEDEARYPFAEKFHPQKSEQELLEARKEIEKLQAENAALKARIENGLEALRVFCDAGWIDHDDDGCPEDDTCECDSIRLINNIQNALEGKELITSLKEGE